MSEAVPRLVFPTWIKIEHMPREVEQDIDYRKPLKTRDQLRAEGHPFRMSKMKAQLTFAQSEQLTPAYTGSNDDTSLKATLYPNDVIHWDVQPNDFLIAHLDKKKGIWIPVELRIIHVKPTAQKSGGYGLYTLICKDDSRA
jgi:hypothetical protein